MMSVWKPVKMERQALVELPRVDLTQGRNNNALNVMRQRQWSPPAQAVPDSFDLDNNNNINKQLDSKENDYGVPWSLGETENNFAKLALWSAENAYATKIQQWSQAPMQIVPDVGPYAQSSPKSMQMEEIYSRKVFIGGLPPDIDEEILLQAFRMIGRVTVDWPHKDQSNNRFPPQGYAFLCFKDECSVGHLLNLCSRSHGKYYIRLSSSSIANKLVQVRPWVLADSEYNRAHKYNTDHLQTVFVGGVPRTITAGELAMLINKKFGGVCYAAIEVDGEHKYPKGAARISFSTRLSYQAAVATRFIKTSDSEKQMEMKPFLVEIAMCEKCGIMSTRQFCSSLNCLAYLCGPCWAVHHIGQYDSHKPTIKSSTERVRHRRPSTLQ